MIYRKFKDLDISMLGFGLMRLPVKEDGRIDEFVKNKYSSFDGELGKKIRSGGATLEELAARADEMGAPSLPGSGRQEYLEGVVNQILFS